MKTKTNLEQLPKNIKTEAETKEIFKKRFEEMSEKMLAAGEKLSRSDNTKNDATILNEKKINVYILVRQHQK